MTRDSRTLSMPHTGWIRIGVVAAVTLGVVAVLANLTLLSGALTHHLQDEDALVEMLSALMFFLAAITGACAAASTPRGEGRWIAALIALAGLAGFVDEISFGQRLYWWFEPIEPYGVPLDAFHDVFTLAYEFARANLSRVQVALLIMAIAVCGVVVLVMVRRRVHRLIPQSAPARYLACGLLLVACAATIDLEFLPNTGPWSFVYALEELFELDAGIALCGGALTQLAENRARNATLQAMSLPVL